MSSDPIPITIISELVETTVDPVHQTVPWQYQGTLEFTLEGGSIVEFDQERHGITFDDPDAPFEQTALDHDHCVFTVNNNDPAKSGIQWKYTVWLNSGFVRFTDDPTVENDSPPPPLP
jgi:hypothetical protein